MAYSINDLKNAANMINSSLEERSRKRGEALANRILGRGVERNEATRSTQDTKAVGRGNQSNGIGWGSDGW